MTVIRVPSELQAWALQQRAAGLRIGCVPTMGCLHEGHLSLITQARTRADKIVLTLFVNPTQFGPNEDFSRYPRTVERDLECCRQHHVDIVFIPQDADMYLSGHSTYVVEETLGKGLCGASRPGHFRGVCTVVAKLFNLALPHVAIFGQKDYQQVAIIQRMVRDLNFPVEIVVAPIIREADGLAMSSRNRNLSHAERTHALGLSQSLRLAQDAFHAGETHAPTVCARMSALLTEKYGVRVDYVSAVDGITLEPVETLKPGVVFAVAAFVGATRLIDNTMLGSAEHGLPKSLTC